MQQEDSVREENGADATNSTETAETFTLEPCLADDSPPRNIIRYIDPSILSPHPENQIIYGDSASLELIESVRAIGILMPLVVSMHDNVILSGHRRWKAATIVGLKEVPVLYVIPRSEADAILILLHANRSRVKTNEQIGREALALTRVEAAVTRTFYLLRRHGHIQPYEDGNISCQLHEQVRKHAMNGGVRGGKQIQETDPILRGGEVDDEYEKPKYQPRMIRPKDNPGGRGGVEMVPLDGFHATDFQPATAKSRKRANSMCFTLEGGVPGRSTREVVANVMGVTEKAVDIASRVVTYSDKLRAAGDEVRAQKLLDILNNKSYSAAMKQVKLWEKEQEAIDKGLPVPAERSREIQKTKKKKEKPAEEFEFATGAEQDRLGNPVPAGLKDYFADTTLQDSIDFLKHMLDYMKLGDLYRKILAKKGSFHFLQLTRLSDQIGNVEEAFQLIVETLEQALPYAVCPTCGGDPQACADCGKLGYMNKSKYEEHAGLTQ